MQKGLISPQPWALRGGVLDLPSSLVWKPSPLLSFFLKNELDLNVLGDQRKGKGIVTIDFLIIFVLKQRDVPPN